ncbi:MAG: TonB-dependent receptor, partial [Vicinamibacterales bacterium]
MNVQQRRLLLAMTLCLGLISAASAWAQAVTTGAITGRVKDDDGLAMPGVTVTITSPAMIGGGRTVQTDEQGTYRFTLLVSGTYRVSFSLQAFATLNINDVDVTGGTTMTINGTMKLGGISEQVTVTSTAPMIDVEAATVGVNWSKRNLETLPFGKSLPSLVGMIPGLYATQYDVGASTMGGTAAPPSRTYGKTGGNVTTYDGVVWDQTFGDFGSYDEIQVTSAAKGAEAMTSGATFNFSIKSGGNQFHGSGTGAWQDASFQSSNINQALLDRGLAATSNKYTRYTDVKADIGGPILLDKLWFYASNTDSYAGQYISGFVTEKTGEPAVYYTRLYGPTAKITFQPTKKMKFDYVQQFTRKYQPYRGADQFKPLEATESQDYWAEIGSAKWTYFPTTSMSADVAINRSGYWWTTGGWSDDVRRSDLTTTQLRGSNIHQYRDPRRWQWNGNVSWLAELGGQHHEVKTGFLGFWDLNRNEVIGYPNQQLYRYRSLAGETNYFLHPDSVQVFDYPVQTQSGVNYNSWYGNDKINLGRKLTLNLGVRYDHYSSWLPEQGNPGTGPFATANLFAERHDFPVYNNWSPRTSMAYNVFGDGRLVMKASYGRYAGNGAGLNPSPGPSATNANPATAIVRTYNNWDGVFPYVPVASSLASTTGGGG